MQSSSAKGSRHGKTPGLHLRYANHSFDPVKIDRSVLYGFKELEVLDEQGGRCELATLADDGKTLVGRGGVTYAYLSPDGAWCDKSGLKPVDLDGREIQPVASSFSAPVALVEKATLEEYLSHNVRSVYLMQSEGDPAGLLAELRGGAIFKFPYSFRGGLEADAGFARRRRRQHLPRRGQPDQDRVRRPAAGGRGGGRGRRGGRGRPAGFRHDMSACSPGFQPDFRLKPGLQDAGRGLFVAEINIANSAGATRSSPCAA